VSLSRTKTQDLLHMVAPVVDVKPAYKNTRHAYYAKHKFAKLQQTSEKPATCKGHVHIPRQHPNHGVFHAPSIAAVSRFP
jgi:hypothetical protein